MEIKFNETVTKQIKAELGDFAEGQIDDAIALIQKLEPFLEPWIEVKKTPFSIGEMLDGVAIKEGIKLAITSLNKLKEMLSEDNQANPT